MTPEVKERIEQIRHGNVPDGFQETIFGLAPVSWRKNRIDEVCTLSSGSTPRRDNAENFIGDILWVTSGELKKRTIADTIEKISEDAAQKSNLTMYDPGTVAIAIYGLEAAGIRGTASIVGKRCTISQACMAFTEFNGVDNEFMYYWYLNNGQILGLRYAQGTKQQNLSTDIVGAFPICYPEIREQREIAKILTTQDKVIDLKERLLEEKRRQKKYLMQQLLTGRKRLPGFNGEWKQLPFAEVFTFLPTNTLSRDCMSETAGMILNIHYGDVLVKYPEILDVEKNQIPFIKHGSEPINITYVRNGDVIIADTAEDLSAGKAVEVQNVSNKLIASGLHTMFCRPNHEMFVAGWLGYYINSTEFHNQLIPLICGVKVSSISKKEIVKTFIAVPSVEEQQAIVDRLSIADREINLLRQDIDYEKQKKKALMQLLLMGIVRVNV